MKFFLHILIAVIGLMNLTACQFFEPKTVTAAESKSCDSLLTLVNGDHDAAMPKMGDLMRYEARAHEEIKQIGNTNPDRTRSLNQTIEILSAAQNAMTDWMNQYAPPAANENADRVVKYLTEQHGKIAVIKASMLGAVRQAETVFNETVVPPTITDATDTTTTTP
jgi:hypothetical protein